MSLLSGLPKMAEISKEMQDKLKVFCEEHFGPNACQNCHDSESYIWCKNNPNYGKNETTN